MSKAAYIAITNHAVIRYLERVAGVDVERIKRGIRRKVRHAVNSGAKSVTIDGFRYEIAGRKVVSVIPADASHEPDMAFGSAMKKRRGKAMPHEPKG